MLAVMHHDTDPKTKKSEDSSNRPLLIYYHKILPNAASSHQHLYIYTHTLQFSMARSTTLIVSFVVACLASTSQGFAPASVVPSALSTFSSSTTTSLNIFGDALKGAFANDDSLGKRKDEGLSKGPDFNENVTVNGKKVQGAVVGQKLTVVAGRARVKIPVNCQKGDCGTCMVNLNGKKVKACQTPLPKGKANIQTL
jgi:ferredoxin